MLGLVQSNNPPKKHKGRKHKSRKGSGKRRHKKSAYHHFMSCYRMTHKGGSLKTIAKAWKRRKKTKAFKLSMAEKKYIRRKVGRFIKAGRKAHGRKRRLSSWELARRLESGSYSSAAQKRMLEGQLSRASKLEARAAKGKATRARKKAMASYVGSGYGPTPGVTVGLNRRRKGRHMAKRKHGYKHLLAMNPPAMSGVFSGFAPSNLMGIAPIVGGAILNGLFKGFVQPKVPGFFQKGIGGVALGLIGAGAIHLGGRWMKLSPKIVEGMTDGAIVETASALFVTVRDQGLQSALGMGYTDYGHWLEASTMSGLGNPALQQPYASFSPGRDPGMRDYADPRQVEGAWNTDGMQTAQYPLPQPGAVPMTTMPPPGSAPAAAHAHQKAYESKVLAEVMSDMGGSDIF